MSPAKTKHTFVGQSLTDADLARTVTIRGEALSVLDALQRSVTHTSYHVGQIVFLAKHLRSTSWRTLSIPRGQSKTFSTAAPRVSDPAR